MIKNHGCIPLQGKLFFLQSPVSCSHKQNKYYTYKVELSLQFKIIKNPLQGKLFFTVFSFILSQTKAVYIQSGVAPQYKNTHYGKD